MGGRLEGKVALVMGAGSTGAGWGNGKAIAVLYAREGASVVCADFRLSAAEETAHVIESEGGRAIALRADVTKMDDIISVWTTVERKFIRADILNNNVGISSAGSVVEVDESEWEKVFTTNLKSCYLAMKQFIPSMQRQGGGSIINTSSIAAIRDTGLPYVAYSASKAAMSQMTKTTAAHYAKDHVRVNAILPGLIKTPMVANAANLVNAYASGDVEEMWRKRDSQVPMGHMGDAWDVAYASLFLASDEAKYVTGIELVVDGGITLRC